MSGKRNIASSRSPSPIIKRLNQHQFFKIPTTEINNNIYTLNVNQHSNFNKSHAAHHAHPNNSLNQDLKASSRLGANFTGLERHKNDPEVNNGNETLNKAQFTRSKGLIVKQFNDPCAGILRTGVLIEDNDISQSNEHSISDLSNRIIAPIPSILTNRSDQLAKEFDGNDGVEDTIYSSLRNDVSFGTSKNHDIQQQTIRHLQNQVCILTQEVNRLTLQMQELREIVGANKDMPSINLPLSSSNRNIMIDPASPSFIIDLPSSGSCEADNSERCPTFIGKSASKASNELNTSIKKKQYKSPDRNMNDVKSRRSKQDLPHYSKTSSKSKHNAKESETNKRKSDIKKKSKKEKSDKQTGCFCFSKSYKKDKVCKDQSGSGILTRGNSWYGVAEN